jgi:hypothetical protein
MADFTDQDKELLDKLRKAFEAKGKTRQALEPWEEHLGRDATVYAARAAMAAKVIEGFSGSWSAQYHYGWQSIVVPTGLGPTEGVSTIDPQGPPSVVHEKEHHVGRKGVPEINFVPYNWGTNAFGSKGPSLVGHPISWEVVGPTLKSPFTDWTWQVVQGAGPNGGDLLIPDVRPDGTVSPVVGGIADMYGPQIDPQGAVTWTIGTDDEPNGGVYLLVTDDGATPGSIYQPGAELPMNALAPYIDTARFELFRVSAITAAEIEIHPNKSFSQFFDLPLAGTRYVRGITLLRPYVTRLAAIPQSGAAGGNDGTSTSGREQTFVVVPPERAATNDNFPVYDGGNGGGSGDGSWIGGGFTSARQPNAGIAVGEPAAYGGKARLPIPIPVAEALGDVEDTLAFPASLVGSWIIETATAPFTSGLFTSRFPVVRVVSTVRDDSRNELTYGTIPICLGWFDMIATDPTPGVLVTRVPETDPVTGLTYWGPGPFIANALADRDVGLAMTLHEPIEALWYGSFALDKVEASRLKNIINPGWVSRFEKQVSGVFPPPGGSGPGRPDKAIFDTRLFPSGGPIPQAANPGSLMDLGFRAVFFPAKEDPNDATQAIPDFDRPILGREVQIDGSIAEKQYLELDYSSGILRLSHPPPTSRSGVPDEPSEIIPNGIQGTTGNNPRGEVVLYAACVPYSMEDSQLGTGNRVTVNRGADLRDVDAYSEEVFAHIDLDNTTFTGVAPFIGPSVPTGADDIILDRVLDCSETGVITITRGGPDSPPLGRFAYSRRTTVTVGLLQRTALGGISSDTFAADPDPGASGEGRYVMVRREAKFGPRSVDVSLAVDFYPGDTTYGSEARAHTIRFEGSKVLPQVDGSLVVRRDPDLAAQLDRVTGHLQPSKLSLPIDTQINGPDYARSYFSETGVYTGMFYDCDASSTVVFGTDNPGCRYFPDIGGPQPDIDRGPLMQFSALGAAPPLWHGIINSDNGVAGEGLFPFTNNFRFVAKGGVFFRDAGAESTGFIGFILDETAPGLTPVVATLTDPTLAPPLHTYIGFQFDSRVSANWRYWTRGVGGGDNIIAIPGVTADRTLTSFQGPYYFVIEANRIPNGASAYSPVCKLGVYDGSKNLIASTTVSNVDFLPSVAGRGFFTSIAVRENLIPGGGADLYLYFAKVILDKDIDDLPPLP